MREGVLLDPETAIRPALLAEAAARLSALPGARQDRMAIVDFALPSSTPRFYIVDLKSGATTSFRTAHGKGSDPQHLGRAVSFSNAAGSHASSLGAYVAEGRYQGVHGLSLRLKGLDPTNDAARARAIVLHSAAYMDPAFRARHGKPGRSFGCFVVETAAIEAVVGALEGGVLIYAGT